ncbi:SpoIID/LytB domain-containing protein [Planctomycetota bacterium]
MPRRVSKAKKRLIGGLVATGLFVVAFLPFSCFPRPPVGTKPTAPVSVREAFGQIAARRVRVLLVDGAASATIGTTTTYTVRSAKGDAVLADGKGRSLPEIVVRPLPHGLRLGETEVRHDAVRITTARDAAVVVNGRRYRGELLVRRASADAISIVNLIAIDSYLYSVLGSETYAGWPSAAHDAQAVVARSYTLWRMIDRMDQAFDVYGSVKDQSYLGVAKEDPRLSAAVDRTSGVVLLYQMKLFRCYYHSTCGGRTGAVEDYFPDAPLLPLSGTLCDHCRASKHYRWHQDIAKADLVKALRRDGVALKRLSAVEVLSRTTCGRAREVEVTGDEGVRRRLAASRFRLAVGARALPSTHFEVRDRGDSVEFRGRGWGHGVGMCQWGAKGMADAGFSANEILKHYYTGATIERIYNRPAL